MHDSPDEDRRGKWVMQANTLSSAWASGRNNFNLMRLIAAWMVIYGHAWAITAAPGADLVTWLTRYRFAGAVAVDAFFVISGFLIAASLERNNVRGYLISRVLRIMPALLVCVALSAFVLGPLLTTAAEYWRQPQVWHYFAVNASLWSSEFFLPGVFEQLPRTAVNGSLWTLPIEAKLYLALMLAWLLGVLTPKRYTPLWALALLAAALFAWWKYPLPEYLSNYVSCTAFFITGTLLWVNRAHVRLSVWPVLGLLVVAALLRGTPWFTLPYFGLLSYGTLWLAFLPGVPMIRHTDLSYGVYLYGWPSQQLALLLGANTPLANTGLATILALVCAALSWFLVEKPALRFKRRFVARAPEASPVGASAQA